MCEDFLGSEVAGPDTESRGAVFMQPVSRNHFVVGCIFAPWVVKMKDCLKLIFFLSLFHLRIYMAADAQNGKGFNVHI